MKKTDHTNRSEPNFKPATKNNVVAVEVYRGAHNTSIEFIRYCGKFKQPCGNMAAYFGVKHDAITSKSAARLTRVLEARRMNKVIDISPYDINIRYEE